jgi:Predicted glycosyltransferases
MGCEICVGIATTGRPEILNHTLRYAHEALDSKGVVLICARDETDVDRDTIAGIPGNTIILIASERYGLSVQRNIILDHAQKYLDPELIIFFDDDFFVHRTYIDHIVSVFRRSPEVVGVTGRVLLDGNKSCGIDIQTAQQALNTLPQSALDGGVSECYSTYGCNMSFRFSTVMQSGTRFNEAFPYYSWLEDLDFSRRMRKIGRIVRSNSACGVHLAAKTGRTSGVRFGYSQVANSTYLLKEGLIDHAKYLNVTVRPIIMNVLRWIRPESYVDRRGRLWGNLIAIRDMITGQLDPKKIERL